MADGSDDRSRSDVPPTLKTLGGAVLLGARPGGERFVVLEPGKPLALIVYLALAPERSAMRAHLLELLWADMPHEAAQHALRQTIWYIRRRAGDDLFTASPDRIVLSPLLEVDRHTFVDSVERRDFERAVAQYHGDFLAGFAMSGAGSASFEQWVDIERLHLRRLFVRSAELLVRRWLDEARFHDAQALARRVRDHDPLEESGWRLLLETLTAAGDAVTARVESDALLDLVAANRVDASPSTTAAIRIAQRGDSTSRGARQPPPLTAPLVGRGEDFAAIMRGWSRAKDGLATHVHVTGRTGIGKSRLLEVVEHRLRATRERVVIVRASIAGRDVPCGLAAEVARALAALGGALGVPPQTASALVALNPSLSSHYSAAPDAADGVESLRRRTLAVRELLSAVAEEQPLALLVDDVQWSDALSCKLLNGVIDGLARERVLIVTAGRSVGAIGGKLSTHITLESLTLDDVGALTRSAVRLPPEWTRQLTESLCTASGGSPALIMEILQRAADQGLLIRRGDGWAVSEPARLLESMAGSPTALRLAPLSAEEKRLLLVLAIAGVPLATSQLATVTNQQYDALLPRLVQLEIGGFAALDGHLWQLAEESLRKPTVDASPVHDVVAIHAAFAQALFEDRARLDVPGWQRLATHARAAGDTRLLAAAFTRFIEYRRQRGDRRRNLELAAALLDNASTGEEQRRLVRVLPLHVRAGVVTRARMATVVSAAAVTVALSGLAMSHVVKQASDGAIARVESTAVPRSLANDTAEEMCPSLSPDGNQAVYYWNREGSPGLYIKAVDGPARRLATGDAGHLEGCGYAKWSPAGHLIAFLARGNADSKNVWVISPDGGQPRLLTSASGIGLAWTPDGQSLAFVDRNSPGEPFSVFSIPVRGGPRRRLTTPPLGTFGDTYCAFSPDGRRMAIVRYSNLHQSDVFVMRVDDAETKGVERLTTGAPGMTGIDWSPDGRHIVFGSHQGLWKVPLTGARKPARVVAFGGGAFFPAFSRAVGRGGSIRLAYQSDITDVNIWRWELARREAKRISSSTLYDDFPTVAPGGDRVAFASNRTGENELWVANIDGSNPQQVTFHRGPVVTSPYWSPDGKNLAFSSEVGDNRDIYVIRPDGSESRRLTTAPSEETNPSWSPDGRWIYFRSNEAGVGQLWKVPANGGTPLRVTTGEALRGFPSPDGRLLYFVRSADGPGLWSVSVNGGRERFVLSDVRDGYWAVADSGIFFLVPRPEGSTVPAALKFFAFATGTVSTQPAPPGGWEYLLPGFSSAADGRFVLWTRLDSAVRDVMLIGTWTP